MSTRWAAFGVVAAVFAGACLRAGGAEDESLGRIVALAFDERGERLYAADESHARVLALELAGGAKSASIQGAPRLGEQLAKLFGLGPEDERRLRDEATKDLERSVESMRAASPPAEVEAYRKRRLGEIATLRSCGVDAVAVNPVTHATVLAVSKRGESTSRLLRVTPKGFEPVRLKSLREARLPDESSPLDIAIVSPDAGTKGAPSALIVTSMPRGGEFAAQLHRFELPLTEKATRVGLRTYHDTHRAWETQAPFTAMTALRIDGQSYVFASTACTPVLRVKATAIKDASGKLDTETVCELGGGNAVRTLVRCSDGQDGAILALTRTRVAYKIPATVLAAGAINEKCSGQGRVVRGWENVERACSIDDGHVLLLRNPEDGPLALEIAPLP